MGKGERESPRLTPEAVPPVEAAFASVSPTPDLSEEVMKKKAHAIIDEYLDIKYMEVGERQHSAPCKTGELDSQWVVR